MKNCTQVVLREKVAALRTVLRVEDTSNLIHASTAPKHRSTHVLGPTTTCLVSGSAKEGLRYACATPPLALGLVSRVPRIVLSFRSANQAPLLVTHNFHLYGLAELVHCLLL